MDKPPRVSETGSLHFKRGLGLPAKEQELENSALEAQETRERHRQVEPCAMI